MIPSKWLDKGPRGDGLALIAGALLPLAFAPFNIYPLAFLAPVVLFLFCDRVDEQRSAAWRGGLFGAGFFGVGVSWVYVAIHDFGYSSLPVAVLLTVLFILALALFPALFAYTAVRVRQRFHLTTGIFLGLLLPLLWLLAELLRAWLFTGFPWLSLGYSQTGSPLAGWAPVTGVYGISLLLVITAALVALTIRKSSIKYLLVALPIWIVGEVLKQVEWTDALGEPISVAMVQGNLPQLTKWDADKIYHRLDSYETLTEPLLGKHDLVMWPENAITVFYHNFKEAYFDGLEQQAMEKGTDLLLGVPLLDGDGERYYTTLMNIGPSGHQFYKKDHLVPFGEFVPFESLLRGLVKFFDLPMSSFSRGGKEQPPMVINGHKVAMTICYEDLFPSEALRNLPEAALMINGSNNAWYGDSLAPHQHLQISRMRAMESGRPIIRTTTNGISALIDSKGQVTARSPQFKQAVLEGTIQPQTGRTPYLIWREGIVLALLGLMLVFLLYRNKKQQ